MCHHPLNMIDANDSPVGLLTIRIRTQIYMRYPAERCQEWFGNHWLPAFNSASTVLMYANEKQSANQTDEMNLIAGSGKTIIRINSTKDVRSVPQMKCHKTFSFEFDDGRTEVDGRQYEEVGKQFENNSGLAKR